MNTIATLVEACKPMDWSMTPRVLMVDDDAVFLHVYTSILQQHFPTDSADTPSQALEMMRSQGYAVIIADLQMPEMDGLSFLKEASRVSPDTMRIMFTGRPDLQTVMAAVNDANIFGFFSKDCAAEDLIHKVHAAVEAHSKRKRQKRTISAPEVLSAEEREFFSHWDAPHKM